VLAGMVAAPVSSVYPGMGNQVLIICFVVVVIGGIGSIRGALLAALLIGVVDTFGKVLLPQAAGVLVYVLMALILLWKPDGPVQAPDDMMRASPKALVAAVPRCWRCTRWLTAATASTWSPRSWSTPSSRSAWNCWSACHRAWCASARRPSSASAPTRRCCCRRADAEASCSALWLLPAWAWRRRRYALAWAPEPAHQGRVLHHGHAGLRADGLLRGARHPLGGGTDGIYLNVKPVLPGRCSTWAGRCTLYYFTLALLALPVRLPGAAAALALRPRAGRHPRQRAAHARHRLLHLPVQAGGLHAVGRIAGLAGFLFAVKDGFVNPELLSWHLSARC
jgi:hypothetical protein